MGDIKPPDYAPPFEIIPPNIRDLFIRCFVDGYKNPMERPTAIDWFDALQKEIQIVSN